MSTVLIKLKVLMFVCCIQQVYLCSPSFKLQVAIKFAPKPETEDKDYLVSLKNITTLKDEFTKMLIISIYTILK